MATHRNGNITPAAFSVSDFCRSHGISRTLFYELGRAGTGPRLMKAGRRVLISIEAAAEWRAQMELSKPSPCS